MASRASAVSEFSFSPRPIKKRFPFFEGIRDSGFGIRFIFLFLEMRLIRIRSFGI